MFEELGRHIETCDMDWTDGEPLEKVRLSTVFLSLQRYIKNRSNRSLRPPFAILMAELSECIHDTLEEAVLRQDRIIVSKTLPEGAVLQYYYGEDGKSAY